MALRRLGAARAQVKKQWLEGRIDDLERRISQSLMGVSVSQKKQLADMRGEVLKAIQAKAGLSGMKVEKPGNGSHGQRMSAGAPVASGVEEARLSQVITEAMDAVMERRGSLGLTSGKNGVDDDLGKDLVDRIEDVMLQLLADQQGVLTSSVSKLLHCIVIHLVSGGMRDEAWRIF